MEAEQPWDELLKETELLTPEFFVKPTDPFQIPEENATPEDITNTCSIHDDKEDEDTDDIIEVKKQNDEVAVETEEETEKVDTKHVNALTAIDKKIVGIYFSAGWCPPCRQFTPLLKDFYEETRSRKSAFEVVFVSFDKKEEDMIEYYRELHADWLAVGFNDPLKETLKTKYKIHAVPKLIIVTSQGEVITTKGRKEIQDKGIICYRNWQEICTFRENRAKSQASIVSSETKDTGKT